MHVIHSREEFFYYIRNRYILYIAPAGELAAFLPIYEDIPVMITERARICHDFFSNMVRIFPEYFRSNAAEEIRTLFNESFKTKPYMTLGLAQTFLEMFRSLVVRVQTAYVMRMYNALPNKIELCNDSEYFSKYLLNLPSAKLFLLTEIANLDAAVAHYIKLDSACTVEEYARAIDKLLIKAEHTVAEQQAQTATTQAQATTPVIAEDAKNQNSQSQYVRTAGRYTNVYTPAQQQTLAKTEQLSQTASEAYDTDSLIPTTSSSSAMEAESSNSILDEESATSNQVYFVEDDSNDEGWTTDWSDNAEDSIAPHLAERSTEGDEDIDAMRERFSYEAVENKNSALPAVVQNNIEHSVQVQELEPSVEDVSHDTAPEIKQSDHIDTSDNNVGHQQDTEFSVVEDKEVVHDVTMEPSEKQEKMTDASTVFSYDEDGVHDVANKDAFVQHTQPTSMHDAEFSHPDEDARKAIDIMQGFSEHGEDLLSVKSVPFQQNLFSYKEFLYHLQEMYNFVLREDAAFPEINNLFSEELYALLAFTALYHYYPINKQQGRFDTIKHATQVIDVYMQYAATRTEERMPLLFTLALPTREELASSTIQENVLHLLNTVLTNKSAWDDYFALHLESYEVALLVVYATENSEQFMLSNELHTVLQYLNALSGATLIAGIEQGVYSAIQVPHFSAFSYEDLENTREYYLTYYFQYILTTQRETILELIPSKERSAHTLFACLYYTYAQYPANFEKSDQYDHFMTVLHDALSKALVEYSDTHSDDFIALVHKNLAQTASHA